MRKRVKSPSRRRFLKKGVVATAIGLAIPHWLAGRADADAGPGLPKMEAGPFQPSWDSLKQYQCPEWFRDAKFGIWAHWSAQCVPEQGDWYARSMYEEGSDDYKYQCEHYGHPSKVGFKDIDRIWHAENWDPERLIGLYKAAGAKYFVSLANHHDNFDNWNSKWQTWNSVALGPRKDIVGTWAKAARKNGMRFGVTVHANRTWDWFDVSHGADKTGPLAGVPYDGHLTKADGKGQWWEGLDPAELYGPTGAARTEEARKAYELKFYRRVMDLLDQHQPDLLYFDDGEPPTVYGLDIAANYYNKNRRWHGGRLDAIMNVKDGSPNVKQSMVLDYERGRSDKIVPHPWQTDTCIGDWHYRRSLYENHQYKTTNQVVRMLVDIVAKNGNLLLNIPVRGNGTIDPDEVAFLQDMAAWMAVNEEAIYATRPWKISGEGSVKVRGGGFSEGGEDRLTEHDFRFTTKGNTLYATAMGWPDSGKLTLTTLAAGVQRIVGDVKSVHLLGVSDELAFTRTADGLVVTLPPQKTGEHAWVLKIAGLDLAASEPSASTVAEAIKANADGTFILGADQAELNGALQVEKHGDVSNIGFWDSADDTASWTLDMVQPATYTVTARYASPSASEFVLQAPGHSVDANVPATGDFATFQDASLGSLEIKQVGRVVLTIHPRDAATWKPINVASLKLNLAK